MRAAAAFWTLAAALWTAPSHAQDPGAVQDLEIESLVVDLGAADWERREAAERRLIECPPDVSGPILRRHWSHANPEICRRIRRICDRIGWLDPAEAEAQIRRAREGLLSPEPGVRARAMDVIARLGHCAFALVREFATRDPDWRVRRALAELLPRVRARDAPEVLIVLLADADDFVKSGAARSLRDLTRQEFNSWQLPEWKAWWTKARDTWRPPTIAPPPTPLPEPPVVVPPRPPPHRRDPQPPR